MRKYLFFVVGSILFLGCSTTPPPNQWEYKSTTAFNAYKQNYLRENLAVAKADLQRAIQHAKMSADLEQLGRIYLGSCALRLATSMQSIPCKNYQEIAPLIQSPSLESYYDFLQKRPTKVVLLPREYQNIEKIISGDSLEYKKVLFSITKPTSLFISAALLRSKLDGDDMQKLIDIASLYGYKRVVLFWLEQLRIFTKDTQQKRLLSKKIEILLYP